MLLDAEEAREASVGHRRLRERCVGLQQQPVLVERAAQYELDLDVRVLMRWEEAVRLDDQYRPTQAGKVRTALGTRLLVCAEIERRELGAPRLEPIGQ